MCRRSVYPGVQQWCKSTRQTSLPPASLPMTDSTALTWSTNLLPVNDFSGFLFHRPFHLARWMTAGWDMEHSTGSGQSVPEAWNFNINKKRSPSVRPSVWPYICLTVPSTQKWGPRHSVNYYRPHTRKESFKRKVSRVDASERSAWRKQIQALWVGFVCCTVTQLLVCVNKKPDRTLYRWGAFSSLQFIQIISIMALPYRMSITTGRCTALAKLKPVRQ